MLKLSGARLCWVVLLIVLATATRAIPRVLTAANGVSNAATTVFVVRRAPARPARRLLSRKTGIFICHHPGYLALCRGFSGVFQQEVGRNRLCLLGAQRE